MTGKVLLLTKISQKISLSDDKNLPLQSRKGKRIMNFNCISISGIMDREHLTSIGKFEHKGIINGRRKKRHLLCDGHFPKYHHHHHHQ